MTDKDIAEQAYKNGFEAGKKEGRTEALKEVWALIWKTPMRLAGEKADLLYSIQKIGEEHGISVEDVIDESFKQEVVKLIRPVIDLVRTLNEKVDFFKEAYELTEEDLI